MVSLDPILSAAVERLREEMGDHLLSVVLFGSRARGGARPESDIDLIIVYRNLDRDEARRKWWQARNRVDSPVLWGPVLLPKEEADKNLKLFLDVSQESRVLFDRDGYFAGRMEAFRRRLQELGSKRVYLPDGSYYWDIKPDLGPGEEFEL